MQDFLTKLPANRKPLGFVGVLISLVLMGKARFKQTECYRGVSVCVCVIYTYIHMLVHTCVYMNTHTYSYTLECKKQKSMKIKDKTGLL